MKFVQLKHDDLFRFRKSDKSIFRKQNGYNSNAVCVKSPFPEFVGVTTFVRACTRVISEAKP